MTGNLRPIAVITDCSGVATDVVDEFADVERRLSEPDAPVNYGTVERYFDFAAKGIPEAYERIAAFYLLGEGVEPDPDIALDYLKKSLKSGNGLAYHSLGVLFVKSYVDGPQDPGKLEQAETAVGRLFSFIEDRPELEDSVPEYVAWKVGEGVGLLRLIGRPPEPRDLFTRMKDDILHELKERQQDYKGTEGEENYAETIRYVHEIA